MEGENPMPSQVCTCKKCGKGFLRGFANMHKTGPFGSLCEDCFLKKSNKHIELTLGSDEEEKDN